MAKPAPSSYEKVGGSSRRYRHKTTGETISRRQFENLRFSKTGWKSWSDYQQAAKTPEYRRWAKQANIRRGEQEPTSDFNKGYLAARKSDFDPRIGQPFDTFLKAIGARKDDVTYDVGDTPRPA